MKRIQSIDISGKKFGRLTAVGKLYTGKNAQEIWVFNCDCGVTCEKFKGNVTSGHTKSCGCYNKSLVKNYKHGMSKSRIFNIFNGAKARCGNKKLPVYKYYGGLGVQMEWKSFDDFLTDMYQDYLQHVEIHGKTQTTLDRINPYGNYSKSNCRWSTWKEQSINKRDKAKL